MIVTMKATKDTIVVAAPINENMLFLEAPDDLDKMTRPMMEATALREAQKQFPGVTLVEITHGPITVKTVEFDEYGRLLEHPKHYLVMRSTVLHLDAPIDTVQ